MKRSELLAGMLGAVVLLALAAGCTTTRNTESMLAAAGFKIVMASTPQQQAHLKTLASRKITTVVREGKTYFVFPDAARQEIYVGQQAQYDAYQKLRVQTQMTEEAMETSELNSEPAWGVWGGWGGGWR